MNRNDFYSRLKDIFSFEKVLSIFSLLICLLLVLYGHENSELAIIFFVLSALAIILGSVFPAKAKEILNILIDKRYLIALIIFIVCVSLQLHGSSVNYYNNFFTDLSIEHDILFGKIRDIRSDEFNVQLPYFFSQYYNDFSLLSEQMSLTGQNMVVGYNAPVIDMTLLAKPFTWGYVFLGNSYGLSWYWCSKLILCILVALDFFLILTKKNRSISIVGALFLVFSPTMQWWFSPHVFDVIFWALTLFVVGYHFFVSKGTKKWLFTGLSSLTVVGFSLALFPSLQVATGLTILALLIGVLIRDKKKICFTRNSLINIIVIILLVSVMLGQFLFSSFDALNKLYNTVYPGERISVGGDYSFSVLFTDLINFFTPFEDINSGINYCEVSTFNHVGVLFLILMPYIFMKRTNESKKDLSVGIFLFLTMVVQIEFMLVGLPEVVARITLFSYINRMPIAYGFTAVIASVWLIYYMLKFKSQHNTIILTLHIIVFAVASYLAIIQHNFIYWPWFFYLAVVLVFASTVILIITKKTYIATTLVLILTFVSGGTINPIVHGVDAIYGHKISNEISALIDQDDSYWIATDWFLTQNFLLANGAKVINSVNFYPDDEKWRIIDPHKQYEFYYNRYSHMIFNLHDGALEFELLLPDLIEVDLNVNTLDELGVKYILANQDYDLLLESNDIEYDIKYTDATGYKIYKLIDG